MQKRKQDRLLAICNVGKEDAKALWMPNNELAQQLSAFLQEVYDLIIIGVSYGLQEAGVELTKHPISSGSLIVAKRILTHRGFKVISTSRWVGSVDGAFEQRHITIKW